MPTPDVPAQIEELRDETWCRDASTSVTNPHDAEHFVDRVGFAACLADSRRPGPSLYVAVCGRRDAVMPRNVQKDPESSLTWNLKDALLRRGKVYYGKMPRGRAMFIAPRMLPHFHALWGLRKADVSAHRETRFHMRRTLHRSQVHRETPRRRDAGLLVTGSTQRRRGSWG